MGYFIIKGRKVLASCDVAPNLVDLASRGEIAVYGDITIPLNEAEYIDGSVRRHEKTQEEKDEDKRVKEERELHRKIHEEVHKIAEERLRERGEI